MRFLFPGLLSIHRYSPHQYSFVDLVALSPLYLEHGMVRHGMNVINDAVQHLNLSQTPVITIDQLLFALAKIIQWNMPETLGEDRYVVMFGGCI